MCYEDHLHGLVLQLLLSCLAKPSLCSACSKFISLVRIAVIMFVFHVVLVVLLSSPHSVSIDIAVLANIPHPSLVHALNNN